MELFGDEINVWSPEHFSDECYGRERCSLFVAYVSWFGYFQNGRRNRLVAKTIDIGIIN